MNLLNSFFDLIQPLTDNAEFWVAISFLGFIALIIYFRAPKIIIAALDRQRTAITRELEEAEKLNQQAQALLARHEAKLTALQSETDSLMDAARKNAADYHTEHQQALLEKIQQQERQAEKRIELAYASAINQLHQEAARLALKASEKLLAENTDQAQLLDQSIAEIQTTLEQKH